MAMIDLIRQLPGFPQTRKERIDAAIGIALALLTTFGPYLFGGC